MTRLPSATGCPSGKAIGGAIGGGSSAGCVTGVPTATACPPKRSGNMPAVPVRPRGMPLAMIPSDLGTMPGSQTMPLGRCRQSDRSGPIAGDCTTCTAMSGNGAGIGTVSISSWGRSQSCGTFFWILSGGARRVVRRLARGPALRAPGRRPPRGQGREPRVPVCARPPSLEPLIL